MKKVKFELNSEDSLIVVEGKFKNHKVFLALDTGASHTTLDLATLIIAGYSETDAVREIEIETANGVIVGYVFKVDKFYALETLKENIEICAYDFFKHHLLTDFDGVLGLDFFKKVKFCIDMNNCEITIE